MEQLRTNIKDIFSRWVNEASRYTVTMQLAEILSENSEGPFRIFSQSFVKKKLWNSDIWIVDWHKLNATGNVREHLIRISVMQSKRINCPPPPTKSS
jgi:hypothetical protein